MNVPKIAREGLRSVGKLFSPKGAQEDTLEALWPDRGGSCIRNRGKSWLEAQVDLSIIIPCYNNAPYLRGCLDSVLGQKTGYSFEAVVIDDGSTDETPEILKAYAANPRVRLLRQENQGTPAPGMPGCRSAGENIFSSTTVTTPFCPEASRPCWTVPFKMTQTLPLAAMSARTPPGTSPPGKRILPVP